MSDDGTCGFRTSSGVSGQTIGDNVSPLLESLDNNGGPTETIALQAGSPAIDAIPFPNCPATDQRGASRPDAEDSSGIACDIGAFESSEIGATGSAGIIRYSRCLEPFAG